MRNSGLVLALWTAVAPSAAAGEATPVPPVSRHAAAGLVSEWALPTPLTARDPAVDGQGNVYYAVARGDRIARFDVAMQRFTEWNLPAGTDPHGVVVTANDRVYFGGRGSGTIGELDPATGAIRMFPGTDPASGIYSLALGSEGSIWYTERAAGRVSRLVPSTGKTTSWAMEGEPYGLVQDRRGRIWVTRISADKLGILDPGTGAMAEIPTGAGSKPRRIAVAPDGMVWVTLYGTGKLIKVDPTAMRIVREYELPGGPNCGPYSVAVDRRGRVWTTIFQNDTVAVLDAANGTFRVVALPERRSGIRNATMDAKGRLWYVATTSGKLGMIPPEWDSLTDPRPPR